jgi:hypothetical protein
VPSARRCVSLDTDDRYHPRLCQVERDGHADLALLHAMSHGHASMVDQNILVIFEVKECVL